MKTSGATVASGRVGPRRAASGRVGRLVASLAATLVFFLSVLDTVTSHTRVDTSSIWTLRSATRARMTSSVMEEAVT